jgi:antitoxin component of MazEF toxin-antitoxin module
MAVKLIPHGITLAVPLPIEVVKRLKLKQGHYVNVFDEQYWLRIRPVSRLHQPTHVEAEEPLRRDPDEPPRETPSTIGFFSARAKK